MSEMSKEDTSKLSKACKSVKYWSRQHWLLLIYILLVIVSLVVLPLALHWNAFWQVLTNMWAGDPSATWVPRTLLQYGDIIVAVIAAIIVALLSITITMYVFLKSALDRIIDENPYITSVARIYQDTTSKQLFWTTLCSVWSLTLALGWYSLLRFQPFLSDVDNQRLIVGIISIIIALITAFFVTGIFWKRCLTMNKNLARVIEERKKEHSAQVAELIPDAENKHFLIGYWDDWEPSAVDETIAKGADGIRVDYPKEWSRFVANGEDLCAKLNTDQYINLFARVEVLLMSGAGTTRNKAEYNESDIVTVIQERSGISSPTIQVEKKDLDRRKYRNASMTDPSPYMLDYIQRFREQLGYQEDTPAPSQEQENNSDFFESTKALYKILEDYRDLLISERYVKNSRKKRRSDINTNNQLDDVMGMGMYYFFLRVLAMFVSAVSIKDFTFNGNVLNFANFYNSTLSNISFYSAQFYHTIFARTKMENVTMDLSAVDNVFFYYTKLTNTSLSNSIFSNVDFESVQMQDCDLSICNFSNCGIKNSNLIGTIFNGGSFEGSRLESSDFSRSKLWNIQWGDTDITDCDFTSAEVQNWRWEKRSEEQRIVLKGCNFSASTWADMRIIHADLSNAVFDDASLVSASFTDSILSEALFCRCQLPQAEFICCHQFEQSSFQDANLFGTFFYDCAMEKSSLYRVNASYSKLEQCILSNGDCAEVYFRNAALNKTVFEKARLYNATFDYALIESCDFKSTLANHVQFTSAKCLDSNFQNAAMADSCFSGTVFERCCFIGADLSDSAATDLTIQQCQFRHTDLSGIRFVDCAFEDMDGPISSCIFSGSRFENEENGKFSHIQFENCVFDEADFANWEFHEVIFCDCSFGGSVFSSCTFRNVTFDHCTVKEQGHERLLTYSLFVKNYIRPYKSTAFSSKYLHFNT